MKDNDKKPFSESMVKMAELISVGAPSKSKLDTWFDALHKYDLLQVQTALAALSVTRHSTFPAIAVLLDVLEKRGEHTPGRQTNTFDQEGPSQGQLRQGDARMWAYFIIADVRKMEGCPPKLLDQVDARIRELQEIKYQYRRLGKT